MMEWSDFLKLYGPMALGWIGLGYLGKIHLDREREDIDSRVRLAVALDALTNMIKEVNRHA